MLKEIELARGQVLMREGDIGDAAYVLRAGKVAISKCVDNKRVILAYMGPGEIIGEMALVDQEPRSATVTALKPSRVQRIPADRFLELLRTDSDMTVDLLRLLFKRLRQAHRTILQLHMGHRLKETAIVKEPVLMDKPQRRAGGPQVHITGLTENARAILPAGGMIAHEFPFRIGRYSRDRLTENHLSIKDFQPYQVSRNHLAIIFYNGRLAVADRGSQLGCELNGVALGGGDEMPRIEPLSQTNELCIGGNDSSWWFQLEVSQGSPARA